MQKVKDRGVFHFGKYKGKMIKDIIESQIKEDIFDIKYMED